MKTYICKIHGETKPYISRRVDDRGNLRDFRCCHICKTNRNAKRYVEKKEEIAKYHADLYKKNKEQMLSYSREKRKKLKSAVINGYGGRCKCCGENRREFLTIDHINGDGAKLRRTTQKGGKLYRDLVKNNFPKDGYRLLCMNCNFSYGKFGYCPHQKS